MNIMERTRPKGFNKKVWEVLYKEAEADKAWAKDIIQNNQEWCRRASESSLAMLGERLAMRADDLAKGAYLYLEMRAHGTTFMGALDPSATQRWESITGRKIGPKKQWRYDHTNNTTSAKRVGKVWIHPYNNTVVSL